MKLNRQSSAPLPLVTQAALIVIGALMVRAAYDVTNSSSAAAFVGIGLLLGFVALRRRRAASGASPVFSHGEQIPSAAVVVALALGALTLASAVLLATRADEGWAAVAIFAGVASITDCLIRGGAGRGSVRF